MSGLKCDAVEGPGRQLTEAQRVRRVDTVAARFGVRLPADILQDCWPYGWDSRRPCKVKPTRAILFDDEPKRVMTLGVEAAWGLTVASPWEVRPYYCGNYDCVELRHWVVCCGITHLDRTAPLASYVHQGFYVSRPDALLRARSLILQTRNWRDYSAPELHERIPGVPYGILSFVRRSLHNSESDITKSIDSV